MMPNSQRNLIVGLWPWTFEVFCTIRQSHNVDFISSSDQLRITTYNYMDQIGFIFFLHWSERVPSTIYDSFECVNFHASPLPFGRGGHPIENMIIEGRTKTVITAHRMTGALDAGDIYMRSGEIPLNGTKVEILRRFIQPCTNMIQIMLNSSVLPFSAQDGPVHYFHRLNDKQYKEFWKERKCQGEFW